MAKSSNATIRQKTAFTRNIMFENLEVSNFLNNQILSPQPISPKIQPGISHPISQKTPIVPKSKPIKSNREINFIKRSSVINEETITIIIFVIFFILPLHSDFSQYALL